MKWFPETSFSEAHTTLSVKELRVRLYRSLKAR